MPNWCHNVITVKSTNIHEFQRFLNEAKNCKSDKKRRDFYSYFYDFDSFRLLGCKKNYIQFRVDTRWAPYFDWNEKLIRKFHSFTIKNAFIELGTYLCGVVITRWQNGQIVNIEKSQDFDGSDVDDEQLHNARLKYERSYPFSSSNYAPFSPLPPEAWKCLSKRLSTFMKQNKLVRLGG
jgi:hypothetical protein